MFIRTLAAFAIVAASAGCAQLPSPHTKAASAPPSGDMRISRVLISEGMKKLQEGRYEDASRVFNAGLKFSPDNARLHFFNALTYHLLYLRGDSKAGGLAVTGYETALSLEPSFYEAALQLGRIDYDSRQYGDAVKAFQRAADIDPQSGEAHLGVAMAAYYAHDLAAARAAIEKAAPLMAKSPAAAQAEAMIYAGVDDQPAARSAVMKFEALQPDVESNARLARRVNQWGVWYASLSSAQPEANVSGESTSLPHMPPSAEGAGSPGMGQAPTPQPGPGDPAYPAMPSPMSGPSASLPNEPAMRHWFECDEAATGNTSSYSPGYSSGGGTGGGPSGGGTGASADETSPLAALPVPCKGAGNPYMALFDVTILRTEDATSRSSGVNLLDGLQYVLTASRSVNDVLYSNVAGHADGRAVTVTHNRSQGLGSAANSANIAYSLNIANATNARNEILAQPSLLALDRQPSMFFSGRNITLGLAGQAGSAGTFTDKPVGVSLSVTPTFIDKDTMLVSVRAARSFIEQADVNVNFGQAMQTSRNAITSNVALKFGQTLILSGLTEQEVQHQSSGVPVLQDIPVLQYLFSNKGEQTFMRSVVILITPRKPEEERELAKRLTDRMHSTDAVKEALLQKLNKDVQGVDGLSPSLEHAYQYALNNKPYLQFRAGDMRPDDWSTSERMGKLLKDVGSLVYF